MALVSWRDITNKFCLSKRIVNSSGRVGGRSLTGHPRWTRSLLRTAILKHSLTLTVCPTSGPTQTSRTRTSEILVPRKPYFYNVPDNPQKQRDASTAPRFLSTQNDTVLKMMYSSTDRWCLVLQQLNIHQLPKVAFPWAVNVETWNICFSTIIAFGYTD